MEENTEVTRSPKTEEEKISRRIMAWINSFPGLPDDIAEGRIQFGPIQGNAPAMAMSMLTDGYSTTQNIIGGYETECPFKITYHIKPGNSSEIRLEADELLNRLGAWAKEQRPFFGSGIEVLEIAPTMRATLTETNAAGEEDYQIQMVLRYKVN